MSISLAVSTPGAIPDLDTLISEVAEWLDRDDLTDRIPAFIQMFEAEANRELRTPEMESSVTFSVSDEDTPLPGDYLAMRAIYREDGSTDTILRGLSPTALKAEYEGATGTPRAYALVSGALRVAPPPADEELFTMDYFARIEALSITAPTNWLLEKHPDAYLWGTLFYAETFTPNEEKARAFRGLLDAVFAKINRSTRGDRYGAGPIVPNTTRQVRGVRC